MRIFWSDKCNVVWASKAFVNISVLVFLVMSCTSSLVVHLSHHMVVASYWKYGKSLGTMLQCLVTVYVMKRLFHWYTLCSHSQSLRPFPIEIYRGHNLPHAMILTNTFRFTDTLQCSHTLNITDILCFGSHCAFAWTWSPSPTGSNCDTDKPYTPESATSGNDSLGIMEGKTSQSQPASFGSHWELVTDVKRWCYQIIYLQLLGTWNL